MLRPLHALAITLTLVILGGCCRDTIREMASLKDVTEHPQHRTKVTSDRDDKSEDRDTKSAVVDDDDDDDRKDLQTGSINGAAPCQGAHIAYQATKEYLKNFGPRPPDQPGDKGPCKADAK
jgi:hypothetical protein